MVLVKQVEVDLSVKGGDAAEAKLDALDRKQAALRKAFGSAFTLKVSSAAAGSGGLLGSDPSLLKRLELDSRQPGGIGILGTGTSQTLQNLLRNAISSGKVGLLSGTAAGGGGAGAGAGQSTTDIIKRVLAGQGAQNQTTTDTIREVLAGVGAQNTSTTNTIKEVLAGKGPGNTSTVNTVRERVDDTGLKAAAARDATTYGGTFTSTLKKLLSGFKMPSLGGGSSSGSGSGGIGDVLNAGGVAGGALPGVAGISGQAASIAGLAGVAVSVLPAIVGLAGGLAVLGGGFAALMLTDAKFAAQVKTDFGGMASVVAGAVKPLAGPMLTAFSQLGGFVKSVGPELKTMFGDAGPLLQPLVKGLEGLVGGMLPGFVSMIKAAGPVFKTLSGAFADLGKSLGMMFGDFAKAEGPSAVILKSVLDLISGVLPVLGKLGQIFATALAPAVQAFGSAIDTVLPALTPLFSILGQFAGAVLSDLAGLLAPVGTLLKGLAPSFTLLAKAAGQVFNTMEGAGVFAILGSALETIAAPLAKFINLIVAQLAPMIPVVMGLVGKFAGILTTLLANGLTAIIGILTGVLKKFPLLVPVLGAVGVAWIALNAIMAVNPFVAIGIAIVVLVGVVVKYHTQIFNFITKTWGDIWTFLKGLWDTILSFAEQWWPLLLGPEGLIVKYHTQIWAFIVKTWHGIASFMSGIWGDITRGASSAWNTVWDQTVSRVTNGVNTVVSWFRGLPGKIVAALGKAATTLYNWGSGVITGMLSGMESIITDVWNFIKGIPGKILSFLGIKSPPPWAIDAGKHIINGVGIGMAQSEAALKKASAGLAASVLGQFGGSATSFALIPGGTGNAGSSPASAQAWARAQLAAGVYGWGSGQMPPLLSLWNQESGWRWNALNPSSGAYGIPQSLPADKMAAAGADWLTDAATQMRWGLAYIRSTYGSPSGAWAHEVANNWYASGTSSARPGWAVVGERGPELMKLRGGEQIRPASVIPRGGAGSGGAGTLQIEWVGDRAGDGLLKWIRENVRVHGGGNAQKAFGKPGR